MSNSNNMFNIANSGVTCTASYTQPNIITFFNTNRDELLRIEPDGKIYYRVEGEMVRINCADDIGDAFSEVVLKLTGLKPEDYVIERYIEKISNHEKSNEYMSKLECAFRKMKLKKIDKI
jgi:hypothetical protein